MKIPVPPLFYPALGIETLSITVDTDEEDLRIVLKNEYPYANGHKINRYVLELLIPKKVIERNRMERPIINPLVLLDLPLLHSCQAEIFKYIMRVRMIESLHTYLSHCKALLYQTKTRIACL